MFFLDYKQGFCVYTHIHIVFFLDYKQGYSVYTHIHIVFFLDYEIHVLNKHEEENAIIKSEQKRKITILQVELIVCKLHATAVFFISIEILC